MSNFYEEDEEQEQQQEQQQQEQQSSVSDNASDVIKKLKQGKNGEGTGSNANPNATNPKGTGSDTSGTGGPSSQTGGSGTGGPSSPTGSPPAGAPPTGAPPAGAPPAGAPPAGAAPATAAPATAAPAAAAPAAAAPAAAAPAAAAPVATGAAGGAVAGGTAAGAAGGTAAAAGLFATPVGWIILIVIAVIVILIMLAGIIMFFSTVPGMVIDQFKQYASDISDTIACWFGSDSTEKVIDDQDIYDVMDYLETMGYDLKGYGFITEDAESKDANYDENVGVIRDPESGLITEAHSDIIKLYIMSDNYIYTIRNFNQVSGAWGPLGWIEAIAKRLLTWVDFFDLIESIEWGRGMISIFFEKDGQLGVEGDEYKNGILGWEEISINPSTKKMKIRRSGWFANYYEYNMDGWAGRYGMPLDFLLSLHIATQKPDLTYDMVTTFETDVKILLRDIQDAEQEACYLTDSGTYIYYSEIEKEIRSFKSDDIVSDLLAWIDDINVNKEEAKALLDLGIEHASECECDTSEESTKVGDSCREHLKAILAALNEANEYKFDTYVPYISKVENHWFRDVYFVLGADELDTPLISTDIDYEKFYNERWTLYETYEEENPERKDEHKLYIYDSSKEGGYGELFEGTQEEADEQGIKVIKKPVETRISDLEEQGVVTIKDGSWSAYTTKTTEGKPERVFPDAEAGTIEEKIYVKVTMNGNVVQEEDGVRGVTNSEIKKIFLENEYFAYDGTSETAETIKKVRDALGMKYGAVDKNKLDKELKSDLNVEIEEDNSEIPMKVSDLTSTVSLTQESLSAFSMLENTHTLDADFIYRDFKELIVELGYFTKEELTDETPKLLQWLIPEIGSAGYPKRALDKDENEEGTLAHSKEDYEANEKNTIKEKLDKFYQTKPEADADVDTETGEETSQASTIPKNNNNTQTATALYDYGIAAQLANKDNGILRIGVNVSDLVNTSSSKSKDRSLSGVTVNEFLSKAREICEYMNNEGYDYCVYSKPEDCTSCDGCSVKCGCSCTILHCNHEVKGNDCGLPKTFEDSRTTGPTNVCCATLVSWVLREVGVNMDECPNQNSAGEVTKYCVEKLGAKVITSYSELKPGDILSYVRDGASNIGHVDILGEKQGGNYTRYNGGHAVSVDSPSIQTFDESQFNSNELCFGIRLFGTTEDGEYEGYLGDEAVVSPVTGILLDYGTYEDTNETDILDELLEETEQYRTNNDKKDKVDKVGYAKILVLNEEIADQIVTCSSHEGDVGQGKVSVSVPQTPDDLDGFTDAQLGLYGYSLFKEDYEKGGLAGYMIYIDGFKCELPGEGLDEDTDIDIDTYEPGSGVELSLDYFKQNASVGDKNSYSEGSYAETLYEPDEVYKLLSETIENQQLARAEAKAAATSLYKFEGSLDGEKQELLVIKEGTVIGRTLTNKELVEEYRNETYVKPEEPEEGEEDTREVQGNYLRIIMKNETDDIIEDVEDYMKLDEIQGQTGDQEYQFQEGDLDILADAIHHEGCGAYDDPSGSREDQLYLGTSVGFTIINKLNTDSGFNPDYNDPSNLWDSSKSPLYNLLCRIPTNWDTGGYTLGTSGGWYAIALGLRQRIDADELEYCDMCMEAAEYIKENDSMNFKNNGKYGSQFSSGEGMPHTCWEQGANYYGDHKIWATFRSNYLFDVAN